LIITRAANDCANFLGERIAAPEKDRQDLNTGYKRLFYLLLKSSLLHPTSFVYTYPLPINYRSFMANPQQHVVFQPPTMFNAAALINDIPDVDIAVAEFNSVPA
jgi:hypothetical protein